MKKIIMLIAVLLMPFTFSYAEEVSIPAILLNYIRRIRKIFISTIIGDFLNSFL